MSAGAFLSPAWYRVAPLRPALKPQARVRRHRFRGAVWYVAQDPAAGRFYRFTPAAYQVLGLMDGRRTMDEVWSEALAQLGDDAPTQEEVIRLVSQLHASDLLHCEVSPDSAELFERFTRQERGRAKSNWRNPFSIRIPLWDPDRFLARTLPGLQPFAGGFGAVLYCAVVVCGALLAALHWPALTENVSDRLLSAQNLLLLWLCFPAVKFLHELSHGYAAKLGGGEVHEMGILLLVFTPIPYVDASAASGFRGKWRRVLVGAAGMLAELFIAALAMMVWAAAEPGMLRAVAFNVMVIAGVSTLVFNANPLLRFDGYYILADLIEMPNLSGRGQQYWRYLAERYLFRLPEREPPLVTPGERAWLAIYTPAALAYRIFVLVAIVMYIAAEWFFIGVLLALWGVATMLAWPILKFAGYLLKLPRAARGRQRAVAVSGVLLGAVLVFLLWVPMPARIGAEGVVWLPEEAHVRAGTDGFLHRFLVQPGARVERNEPLVESQDPVIVAQLDVAEARLAELEARLDLEMLADPVKAEITRQALRRETAAYDRLLERAEQLVVHSATAGRFVVDRWQDAPGRYVAKGGLIGYVLPERRPTIRAVVSQDDIDLVRGRLVGVEVRPASRVAEVYPATVLRAVPAAGDRLPSRVLSSEGGGTLAADPREPRGGKSVESTFQFDLELPPQVPQLSYGGRVHVRFSLEPEPLAQQWARRVRQAFLARFSV